MLASRSISSPSSIGYTTPIAYALGLHVLVVFVLVGLPSQSEPSFVPKPRAIQATLLALPKPLPKPVTKPRPMESPKKPAEPVVTQAKPKPESKPEPAPVIDKKPEPVEVKVDEQPEDPGIDPSLDEWLEEEAAEFQAEEDEDKVAHYSALIEQQVYRLWSRPPSARNNMEVLLSIRLLPRGDIVSVSVARGSGNAALDRSAVAAVKRADRIAAVAGMEPRLFEAYFREFEMRFRPEDMRL